MHAGGRESVAVRVPGAKGGRVGSVVVSLSLGVLDACSPRVVSVLCFVLAGFGAVPEAASPEASPTGQPGVGPTTVTMDLAEQGDRAETQERRRALDAPHDSLLPWSLTQQHEPSATGSRFARRTDGPKMSERPACRCIIGKCFNDDWA